jgi:hypothetical protein
VWDGQVIEALWAEGFVTGTVEHPLSRVPV